MTFWLLHYHTPLHSSFTHAIMGYQMQYRQTLAQPKANSSGAVSAFQNASVTQLLYALAYPGGKRDSWVSLGHNWYWSDYRSSWGKNDIKNSNTLPRPDGNHSWVLKQFNDEIAELLETCVTFHLKQSGYLELEDNICDAEVPEENYKNIRLMPILDKQRETIKG